MKLYHYHAKIDLDVTGIPQHKQPNSNYQGLVFALTAKKAIVEAKRQVEAACLSKGIISKGIIIHDLLLRET